MDMRYFGVENASARHDSKVRMETNYAKSPSFPFSLVSHHVPEVKNGGVPVRRLRRCNSLHEPHGPSAAAVPSCYSQSAAGITVNARIAAVVTAAAIASFHARCSLR